MASMDTEILNDLLSALRACGAFALVTLDGHRASTAVPRANVLFERRDSFASEPWPTRRWIRLQVRVLLRTRSDSAAEGVSRLNDLAESARDALLSDPSRGGRCRDLSLGRATEVRLIRQARDERYPERATSLDIRTPGRELCLVVRCHYEIADSGAFATAARLDGDDLFSSGPCEFVLGPWQRERIYRGFPGIVGELVFDLGLRGREITQRGRLEAETAQGLHDLLAAIHAKHDGQTHTLTDHDGQTYENVLIESFQPTSPVHAGVTHGCDYTLTYRQLP